MEFQLGDHVNIVLAIVVVLFLTSVLLLIMISKALRSEGPSRASAMVEGIYTVSQKRQPTANELRYLQKAVNSGSLQSGTNRLAKRMIRESRR